MIFIRDTPDAYICDRCGTELESYEKSCSCGGEPIGAYKCEICKELVPEYEIEGCEHNVCQSCINKKRYDLDFCTKVGETTFSECNLNSFLASFFTESEINDLMLSALKECSKIRPVDGSEYLKYNGIAAADLLASETNC